MNSDFRQPPSQKVGPMWALRTLYRLSGAEHEQEYMHDHAEEPRPRSPLATVLDAEIPGWTNPLDDLGRHR